MSAQPDPRAGLGPRARAVADWIGHHAVELTAVAIPSGLGAISPAYLALSGAVGALWGAHEWRVGRHNTRTALDAAPARELDAPETVDQPEEDIDVDRHTARR